MSIHQDGEGTTTLPWFTEGGERSVVRHACNNRVQESVVEQYAGGIREKGIVPGVRGEGWFQWSKGRSLPALAVSFGTLADAAYVAFERWPEDEYVAATKAAGLQGCRMLHERTPRSVITWLVDYHNTFHGGAGYTVLQLLNDAVAAEQAWVDHKQEVGLTVASVGGAGKYEKVYGEWIRSTYPTKFQSALQYQQAMIAVHGMQKLQVPATYQPAAL